MAAQTDIPLVYTTDDPEALKRELGRLAAALATYHAGVTGQAHAGVVQRRFTKRPINDPKAAFWQITPVSLSSADAVHKIALPPPDVRNAGLVLAVLRKTALGTISLSSPGCLINGFTTVELVSAIACTWVTFDGEDYYGPPGALWGV